MIEVFHDVTLCFWVSSLKAFRRTTVPSDSGSSSPSRRCYADITVIAAASLITQVFRDVTLCFWVSSLKAFRRTTVPSDAGSSSPSRRCYVDIIVIAAASLITQVFRDVTLCFWVSSLKAFRRTTVPSDSGSSSPSRRCYNPFKNPFLKTWISLPWSQKPTNGFHLKQDESGATTPSTSLLSFPSSLVISHFQTTITYTFITFCTQLLYHPNNICWTVQITQFLITLISSIQSHTLS